MATLETLEGRTLLSNVTVSFPTPSSPLTITGDTFNDNFTITENLDGTVTVAPGATRVVPGVGVVPGSTIDGLGVPFTTGSAVSSIIVNLPGTTNFDFVTLTGQGKTTPTIVRNVTVTATGANLNFAANNVDNSGNLVVSDTFTSAVNAVLTATVNNSSFATLSITQTGGGPDPTSVTLGNDSISSNVSVSEGNANGDSITLATGDSFGTTTLLQGNGGPTNPNSLGNSDTVSVSNAKANNLLIEQLLNGNNNKITVNTLSIAAINPTGLHDGLTTSQGNGNTDITTITGVTPFGSTNVPFPPGFAVSNIVVGQGSGSGDSASVTSSTVPGSISITQSDVAGNAPDTATISNDHAGSTAGKGNITITQGNAGGTLLSPPGDQATVTGSTATGNITIGQGSGSGDSATVSVSTAGGNLSITESDVAGNPFGDKALVTTDTVGGNVTISQGSASGDTATVDPTTVVGNVTITQGSGDDDTATVAGLPADLTTVGGNVSIAQGDGNSDTATVEYATVLGNVSISQGNGNSDAATVEFATVGGDVSGGNVSITQGSGSGDTATIFDVTADGNVTITQTDVAIATGDTATVEDATVVGDVSITQGSGSGDTATVLDVTAGGNITISQSDVAGNALGDTASVIGVTAGSTVPDDQFPTEVAGNVTITQGDAPGDVAYLNLDVINNVSITQGDNVQVPDGSTVASDVAEINDTTVTSNIIIIQGTGNSTAPDAGNYVAAIGFDYLGYVGRLPVFGTQGSSPVTAGGFTQIDQNYANNQVFLGDVTSSFTTFFLDVFTGSGGGAFVMATKTTVIVGSVGSFTIEGLGSGNTYVDGGGTFQVSVDSDNFNS